jgi:alpha-tubulin suppressor-like RCC1 family protein
MDLINLIQTLETQLSSASTAEATFVLSQAIYKLNLGTVRTVTTYTDLFGLTKVATGQVVFVEDESTLYYKYLIAWQPINKSLNAIGAWAWGNNAFGRLGDLTVTDRSSPVSVVGGFSDWTGVSAGDFHSVGTRANGSAWAWGSNGQGQLGDGTATSRRSPVSVVGGFSNWTAVSAGRYHSLGTRADGTVWAWGLNGQGRLGDGTITARSSPVSVVGGFADWTGISAGLSHSLGTRADGSAWAWGLNTFGRLGDLTVTARISPVSVVGGFSDWTGVSAGSYHSLGTRADGTVWAWGNNAFGRLGDLTVTDRSSPVSVVGGFSDWTGVSAGFNHSLGTRADGSAWAWGSNTLGQLGDLTVTSRRSPVSVVGGFADWTGVSAGRYHSLGTRANGSAWAWGYNGQGRLGDGTATGRSSPVSVVGGFADWTAVSAGNAHSLALRNQ